MFICGVVQSDLPPGLELTQNNRNFCLQTVVAGREKHGNQQDVYTISQVLLQNNNTIPGKTKQTKRAVPVSPQARQGTVPLSGFLICQNQVFTLL
jgi:uncharacterized protein YeaC (DUF1315 family)